MISCCCHVQGASGDDGPENHKAGLYRLIDLEPLPTIAFLITDAPPHLDCWRPGATHSHELRWLEARGLARSVASDVFRVFHLVQEHYAGNLVLNCVMYSGAPADVYGSLVQRTGGMLMEPVSRQPQVLAKGMLDVIRTLLSTMPGGVGGDAAVSSLEGFQLYDVSGLPARECEQVRRGDGADAIEKGISGTPHMAYTATAEGWAARGRKGASETKHQDRHTCKP